MTQSRRSRETNVNRINAEIRDSIENNSHKNKTSDENNWRNLKWKS